jgi:hypothetical protein
MVLRKGAKGGGEYTRGVQCYNPEDYDLNLHHCENFKTHMQQLTIW